MNLQNEVYTHVIITFTKAHHFITNVEHDLLRSLGAREIFETADGNQINASNIAEIMTVEKYYDTFPDKSGVKVQDNFPHEEFKGYSGIIDSTGKTALNSLVKGFKKHGKESNPIYQKIVNRLKSL